MVTSRVIRPKKHTLTSVVETGTRTKKIGTRAKLLIALKGKKNGLNLTDLAFEADIKSCGNLSQMLKFLIRSKEVSKETCPTCNHTELYKLNI
jgi:predicted nucleic-acid-binding Zn-ribbon protein